MSDKKYIAKIQLDLSEANWDTFPEQAGDASHATFEVELPDGPWVQFTSDTLRTQDGACVLNGLSCSDGYWSTSDEHGYRAWSDVTIEIIEAPSEFTAAERLEYLRTQIRAECISYGEIAELQGLAHEIDPGDVELLEWAGVPEHGEETS